MKQKIYNLIVLDASGSMYSIRNEAIAGVVETIQTIRTAQKDNANQEHLFSLVVFNGAHISTVYNRMPITNVSDFNEKDYQPTDNTPPFRYRQTIDGLLAMRKEVRHSLTDRQVSVSERHRPV